MLFYVVKPLKCLDELAQVFVQSRVRARSR